MRVFPLDLRGGKNHAARGVPDGMLCRYWDASGERVIRGGVGGDTLAEFIVAELADTYDPDEDGGGQIANAVNALKTAHSDLRRVMDALENIGG